MGLVLTSCQSDEPFAPGAGEEVQASFTISVPDAMGTRAAGHSSAEGGFSNGAGNLNYTVALLNQNDKVMYSETCQSDGKTATFHPTVVQGYTYKVVAYATFGNAVDPSAINEAFDGNDALASIATLKGISDESEDAYYCFDTEVMGGAEMSATLRRPFGKLRLVATDYDKLQTLGTDVASVKVTYGENVVMETHFNAMAEAFGGKATSKEFEANKATYAEAANELTVFTDYLPASKTGETMYPFTIVTTYTNGETYTRTFAQDIPVKRNYLTTLRGDFFTTEAALTLTVDEMFTNEETINLVSVSNASQLQEAIDNAPQGQTTEIVLNNDIDLTQPIVFGVPPFNPAPAQTRSEEATAATFIIDLNGKTIENPNGYVVENYSAELTISGNGSLGGNGLGGIRSHGGKIVINDGTFTGSSDWSEGTYQHILKAVNTEVTINGGTFDATIGGMTNAMINVSENSVVTINGGTFKNVNVEDVIPQFAPYMFTYEKNGKLIINDGNFYGGWRFNGETATTDIYGGNFTVSYDGQSFHANSTHVLTIYGGAFSLENGGKLNPVNHVADGYEALKNQQGDKYYVVPTTDADVVVTTADELVAALEADEGVYFLNDIKIDPANMSNAYGKTGINVKNGQTIDGGGHTLNIQGAGGTWDSGINTTGGLIKNLTVTGSFRGIFINHTSTHSEKVVLDNVTITGTVYTISCDQGLNQGIEATGCTFNGWTSFAKTAGEAKFVNCYFGEGNGYKYCRPYSNTEFVNCTFCPGYAVDETQATVTFTNCTWEE